MSKGEKKPYKPLVECIGFETFGKIIGGKYGKDFVV